MNDHGLPVLNQATYVKETFIALWECLPVVLLAGLLFTGCALPALLLFWVFDLALPGLLLAVFTAGPAWIAAVALVARGLLRESAGPLDFFRAFGKHYLSGAFLCGLYLLPVAGAAILLPLLNQPGLPAYYWVGLGGCVAGFFFLSALYLYTHPQLVLYPVGARLALRNGFVLAIKYLSNTLGLLALALLLALLAARVSYFLLIVLPTAWVVFVINNFRMVIQNEFADPAAPTPPRSKAS